MGRMTGKIHTSRESLFPAMPCLPTHMASVETDFGNPIVKIFQDEIFMSFQSYRKLRETRGIET